MPEGSTPDIADFLEGADDPVEESLVQTAGQPSADQTLVEIGGQDDSDYDEELEDSIDDEEETMIEMVNVVELDTPAQDLSEALESRSEIDPRDDTLTESGADSALLNDLEAPEVLSSSDADASIESEEIAVDDESRRETLRSGWGQTGTQSKLVLGRRGPLETTSSGLRRLNLKLGRKKPSVDETD